MKYKTDKGVAGLTIFLSLIVMLFVIGLLVMIFTLMGTGLRDSTYDKNTAITIVNESLAVSDTSATALAGKTARDSAGCSVASCRLASNGTVITSTNYTVTDCDVKYKSGGSPNPYLWNATTWKCTYSYTWSADNDATKVMNDTTSGIAGVTDWFSIFVVIGAMVVLILLTVIIISAIRGSGMISSGSTSAPNRVGSA